MAAESVPRSPPELLPKHTIFLSHSGKDKPFVEQLHKDLESVNQYSFFDQNSHSLPIGARYPRLIFEAAKQCVVAVVVLSPAYLESKWPMLELIAFVESMKAGHRISLVPLFYKLTPDDIRGPNHGEPPEVKQGYLRISKPLRNANEFTVSNKEEVKTGWEDWTKGWQAMAAARNGKVVFSARLCEDAINELRKHNGLQLSRFGNSEVNFRKSAVDAICALAPPAVSFDITDIRGCGRLCEVISKMFVDKEGVQFLGLYGDEGSGKSTICCEAMCGYFQKEFQGRFCRVELEFETDSKASTKKREARLRQTIQQLVGLDKGMQAISMESLKAISQLKTYLKDLLRSRRVFLVVDNVSQSSREEAENYVKATFAPGSKVLVTSRNQKVLEAVLGGSDYCRPLPGLEKEEASQLVLSKAARSKLGFRLEPREEQIVDACVAEGCIDEHYHPLTLRTLATYLQASGEDDILSWEHTIESLRNTSAGKDFYRLQLLQYEKLDKTSKLVFLDLAIFAQDMILTHEDFQREPEYDAHPKFEQAFACIALLHGVTLQQAKTKVKKLQGTPFVDSTATEIWVPQSYVYFAHWLIKRDGDREEKDWCLICEPEEEQVEEGLEEGLKDENEEIEDLEFADLPNVAHPPKLVRVSVSRLSLAYSDHLKIQQWRFVSSLQLSQVSYLRCLNLQGLHSLRVLTVEECEDLEKIVCSTCDNSSPSDGVQFCYQSPLQSQSASGCMPNLRFVQLFFLPSLMYASFPEHCWNLETLWFYMCPNLACLPDLRFCKKLKRLRLPCGDFQGFQGLSGNQLLTELAFHWDPDTVRNFTEDMRKSLLLDIMNLTNLKVLDIVDESETYEWIPAGFGPLNVAKLVHLTFLDLSWATTIVEVEGLECLSHLTSLGLYGCCELRTLPNLTRFNNLKWLCIGHCHKLKLLKDGVPSEVKDFHGLGESCSFGEHECLPTSSYDQEGVCKICHPVRQEWDEIYGHLALRGLEIEQALVQALELELGDQADVEDGGKQEEVEGGGDQEEVEGDKDQEEVEGDKDQEEVEGDGDQEEVEGDGDQEEVEGDGDQEEVEDGGEHEEVEGDKDQEEVEGDKDQEEVEGDGDQEEVEDDGDQEEVEDDGDQEENEQDPEEYQYSSKSTFTKSSQRNVGYGNQHTRKFW